ASELSGKAERNVLSASACDVVPMIRSAMLRARSVVGSAADPMTYPPRSRWPRQGVEWSRLVTGSLTAHSVPKFHRRANQAACAVPPAHARSAPPAWPAVQGGSDEALF